MTHQQQSDELEAIIAMCRNSAARSRLRKIRDRILIFLCVVASAACSAMIAGPWRVPACLTFAALAWGVIFAARRVTR
jgi:fatty acid desaturase